MRHLVGVLLAIVMAAAVFFAASWGYLKLLILPVKGGPLPAGGGSLIHNHAVLEGFGALLAVGLLAGILIAVPRISPLASGLPGLVLLAWTGVYLFGVQRGVRYIPLKTHAYGLGFEAMLFNGVLALLGMAMIVPLFVPSRWRARPFAPAAAVPAPYEAAATTYPELQDTQTMADGGLISAWTETRPQPYAGPSQAPWGPAEPGGSSVPGSLDDTAEQS
jgi:hypothetical protein